MELPTYTSIWRIEKRLYKLYDFRLPMPLPVGQIAVFTAVTVPYIVLLTLFGLPFNHTLFWLYVLPPGLLTWLATRPVLESKRLPELLTSQARYLGEPSTWCRMAPLAEKEQVVVFGRVWRRASALGAAEADQVEAGLPARSRAALPAAARVARPATAEAAGPSAARRAGGRLVRARQVPGRQDPEPDAAGTPQPERAREAVAPQESHWPHAGGFAYGRAAPGPVRPPGGARGPEPVPPQGPPSGAPQRPTGAPHRPTGAPQRHTGAPQRPAGVPQGPAGVPRGTPPAGAGWAKDPFADPGPWREPGLTGSPGTGWPLAGYAPAASLRRGGPPGDAGAGPEAGAAQEGGAAPEGGAGPEAGAGLEGGAGLKGAAGQENRPRAGEGAPPAWGTAAGTGWPVGGSFPPGGTVPRRPAPPPAPATPASQPPAPQSPAPQSPASEPAVSGHTGPGPTAPERAGAQPPAPQSPAPQPPVAQAFAGPPAATRPAPGAGASVPGGKAPDGVSPQSPAPQPPAPGAGPPGASAPGGSAPDGTSAQPPAPLPPAPQPPAPRRPPPVVIIAAQRSTAGPSTAGSFAAPPAPPRSAPGVERALSGPGERAAGWRSHVTVVPGGRGPGRPDHVKEARARAVLPLDRPRLVVVLGCTVGAGQTVVTLMLADLLAGLRGEPVAALDLNPGPASLTELAHVPAITVSALLADRAPGAHAAQRGQGPAQWGPAPARGARTRGRLDVICQDAAPDGTGAMPSLQHDRLVSILASWYPLTLADPGAAAVAKLLAEAGQLILVAPASPDAAQAVSMTCEWLAGHGHAALARRSIAVLNGVSQRSVRHAEQAELVLRGRSRAIVRVPWDDHLAEPEAERGIRDSLEAAGGPPRLARLRPAVQQAYTALAGVLVSSLIGDPVQRRAAT